MIQQTARAISLEMITHETLGLSVEFLDSEHPIFSGRVNRALEVALGGPKC